MQVCCSALEKRSETLCCHSGQAQRAYVVEEGSCLRAVAFVGVMNPSQSSARLRITAWQEAVEEGRCGMVGVRLPDDAQL